MTALREVLAGADGPRGRLVVRVLPSALYAGRARMLIVRSSLASRSAWLAIVSGFFGRSPPQTPMIS